jgi:hypothetical protein
VGPDVDKRSAQPQDIVDFAWVDDADKIVSMDDKLKVRRGKGSREFAEWLIGEAKSVAETASTGAGKQASDSAKFGTAPDETKDDTRPIRQPASRLDDSVQGMAGTMIAGVHHDELSLQTMRPAEALTPDGVESNGCIKRPWRQDKDLFGTSAFFENPASHKSIQGEDLIGVAQSETRKFF